MHTLYTVFKGNFSNGHIKFWTKNEQQKYFKMPLYRDSSFLFFSLQNSVNNVTNVNFYQSSNLITQQQQQQKLNFLPFLFQPFVCPICQLLEIKQNLKAVF